MSAGGGPKNNPPSNQNKVGGSDLEGNKGLDDRVVDASQNEEDDAEKKTAEAGGGTNEDNAEKKTAEAGGRTYEDDVEKKPVEAGGGSDEDPEEKKQQLLLAIELLKKKNFVQKLEFSVISMAYRNYQLRMGQDRCQILQETEASVLSEKMSEVDQELQAIGQERREVDLKLDAINSEIAAVEKLEDEIANDRKLVDVGRKEVSDGNRQVALAQDRLAAERQSLKTEKYNLFLEKRTLDDLVKDSQRKQQAAVLRFLKWLLTRPLSSSTSRVCIYFSAFASIVAFSGVFKILSEKSALELLYLAGTIIVNEVNDKAEAWRQNVERADKRGKNGQEGSSDSDV